MELIKLLTEQMGITQDQAQEGVGLLFRFVKDKLNASEYSLISDHLPGLDQFVDSATGSGFLRSGLGGLASGLKGGTLEIGGLIGMVDGFSKIGLDTDMISKFMPIIISFVQEKGDDGVVGLLSNLLV